MDDVVESWMDVMWMGASRKEMDENMDDWSAANRKEIRFALRLLVALGLAETSDATTDVTEAFVPTKNLLNIIDCAPSTKLSSTNASAASRFTEQA
jgi:hypothetical protein